MNTDLERTHAERELFTEVSFTEDLESNLNAIEEQIIVLHRRVLGTTPDDNTIDELVELWALVEQDSGSPVESWATVLSTLLRDPEFILY